MTINCKNYSLTSHSCPGLLGTVPSFEVVHIQVDPLEPLLCELCVTLVVLHCCSNSPKLVLNVAQARQPTCSAEVWIASKPFT